MEQNQSREMDALLRQMRAKGRSILFVGATAGICIVLSVLIGIPIPPAWALAIVVAIVAFIAFQMIRMFQLINAAKRLRGKGGPGGAST